MNCTFCRQFLHIGDSYSIINVKYLKTLLSSEHQYQGSGFQKQCTSVPTHVQLGELLSIFECQTTEGHYFGTPGLQILIQISLLSLNPFAGLQGFSSFHEHLHLQMSNTHFILLILSFLSVDSSKWLETSLKNILIFYFILFYFLLSPNSTLSWEFAR